MKKKRDLKPQISRLLKKERPTVKAIAEAKERNDKRSKMVTMIEISSVKTFSDFPRQNFDEEVIKKLSERLKTHGFLKPINVNDCGTFFSIITGEKYWKAAKLLNLEKIPAHIHSITSLEQLEMSLKELMKTEELNSLLIAQSLLILKKEYKLNDQYLAKKYKTRNLP